MLFRKNPNPTLLIVDDDSHVRESLNEILSYHRYRCLEAGNGKQALDLIKKNRLDLILLDLRLPRVDGLDVLKQSIQLKPDLPVIIISGHGTIPLAVEATKKGAYDFLEKPLEAERTLLTVQNALEKNFLKLQRDQLLEEVQKRYQMIGNDPEIQKVFSLIDSAAKVDSKVLISGEQGTGKELVARAIHHNSGRLGKPFVPVNCSAIPESLIESELFGYVKGAFTGASSDRAGKFQQAAGGTLFLDEIGDMSLMMQAKVLRVIEDGCVQPVGSSKEVQADVRIIAATNKNLRAEIEEGNFRSDLFFRLNVIPISLPPLQERKNDIPPLAEYFLKKVCADEGLPKKSFSQTVWPILKGYDWPGNVRELRNLVERAAVLTADSLIEADILSEELCSQNYQPQLSESHQTLRQARAQFEREFILNTLAAHNNKIQQTADALGIQRSHLWKKMKRYGITLKN
ncbi:MAG: sigma-54-dependent transcriptional regulator [bacterium]